jgi:Xaa-Pro aminopeptidase
VSLRDPAAAGARRAASAERLDALRRVLDGIDADGAFLRTRRSFSWLTAGGDDHVVLASEAGVTGLLVTADRALVITPSIEAARIREEEIADIDLEVEEVPWWEPAASEEVARRIGGERLATDDDLEDPMIDLRSRLAPIDQERLAVLGSAATAALTDALAAAIPGMTEAELAVELLARLPDMHAPVVLVAADDRIERYRHPIPTATPIRRRVMLVLVGERWGLHVAVTRFREFAPPSADLQRRWEAVGRVEQAMHEATEPGATLGDVVAAARSAYEAAGVPDEWRDHHQGGSIGFQGRERVAVPDDPHPIEPGMAFAWNPSIAGVKLEDTFILGDDGSRRIVTDAGADED